MTQIKTSTHRSRHGGRFLVSAVAAALAITSFAVPSATAVEANTCVAGGVNPNVGVAYVFSGDTETNPIDLKFDADGDLGTTDDLKVVGSATFGSPTAGQMSVAITGNYQDGGVTYTYEVALCLQGTGAAVESGWLADGGSTSPAIGIPASGYPTWAYVVRETTTSEGGEWCSPGYWKNNPGAWGPTGYTPSSIDSVTGKTFGEILANPKMYASTGDYERIADILSGAHPGVDFDGTRYEDSCPLPADESSKSGSSKR